MLLREDLFKLPPIGITLTLAYHGRKGKSNSIGDPDVDPKIFVMWYHKRRKGLTGKEIDLWKHYLKNAWISIR
jgi:hypothetical protein